MGEGMSQPRLKNGKGKNLPPPPPPTEGGFAKWKCKEQLKNSRILTLTPGAIVANSADNRSTKPGIKVVPPVTTTFASRVACKSGSTWPSVARIRLASGCSADGGCEGIVEAEGGRIRVVNLRTNNTRPRPSGATAERAGSQNGSVSSRRVTERQGTHLVRQVRLRVKQDLGDAQPRRAEVRVVPVRELERPRRLALHDTEEAGFRIPQRHTEQAPVSFCPPSRNR